MTNKLATFNLCITNLQTDWMAINLRQSNSTQGFWAQTYGYSFLIRSNNQIQVYKHGIGTLATTDNGILLDGKSHQISVGAVDVSSGVRLILGIDGNIVMDYTDTSNPVKESSYMSVITQPNDKAVLTFTGTTDDCGDHENSPQVDNDYSYLGGPITGYRNTRNPITDDMRLLTVPESEEDSYIDSLHPVKDQDNNTNGNGSNGENGTNGNSSANENPPTGDNSILMITIAALFVIVSSVTAGLVLKKKKD